MSDAEGRAGWHSDLPRFRDTPAAQIRGRLEAFVRDAGQKQIRAWTDSLPILQGEASEVLAIDTAAARYSAILEYQLPMYELDEICNYLRESGFRDLTSGVHPNG